MQTKYASYRLSQRLGISLALLLLAACTSVPFNYPREASYQGKAVTTGSLAQLDETWLHGQSQHTAVYPLSSGSDAYQIRLDMINRAQATIDAQYFLIKPDAAGVGFSGALLRAADRGVRVRLLLDDIFTTADDEGLALLNTHDNIQVRLFNPLSRQGFSSLNYVADFKRANRRMHNKSLTVDGLVGGRNITSGGRKDSDVITTLHTKAILVDRQWLFVGSLNVDPRSIEINTEMGIIAHAPELASDLANAAEQSLRGVAYVVELKPDGSLRWRASTEEGEVIVTKEPESSWWRRFLRHVTDRGPALVQTDTVDRA